MELAALGLLTLTHLKESHTHPHLCSTKLTDRVLWFDGETTWDATKVAAMSSQLSRVKFASDITPAIHQYNRFAPQAKQIHTKTTCDPLPPVEWNLPPLYLTLDVVAYAAEAHTILVAGKPAPEIAMREQRLARELMLFRKMGHWEVLRGVIWLINTLTVNHVVWGVGRGSSVASYLLYVIGVHDVDSFAYELDVNDFLHE